MHSQEQLSSNILSMWTILFKWLSRLCKHVKIFVARFASRWRWHGSLSINFRSRSRHLWRHTGCAGVTEIHQCSCLNAVSLWLADLYVPQPLADKQAVSVQHNFIHKTLDNTFHIHFSFTGIPSNMQNMHNMQNAVVKPAVQKYSRKSIITFCQYRYGREFF